jgi:BirA family biotin operon repressor/biotin-[acetyl-CoA-carboxylase] ligase
VYKILAKLPFETNYVHYLPSCHSTNEVAQDLLQTDALEGTVVITDNQIAGKGQRGNVWISDPYQNLTFSIILRPRFLEPNEQFLITIAVSLALKETLEGYLQGEVKTKWPNDIYYNDKKMAGLLIENVLRGSSFESCIIGIGLNVNQSGFAEDLHATSMKCESGKEFDLNIVLNALRENIANYYFQLKGDDKKHLIEQYRQSLLGLNEKRQFSANEEEFTGIIEGTDAFGRLLIKHGDETLVFQHKEVQMLF